MIKSMYNKPAASDHAHYRKLEVIPQTKNKTRMSTVFISVQHGAGKFFWSSKGREGDTK